MPVKVVLVRPEVFFFRRENGSIRQRKNMAGKILLHHHAFRDQNLIFLSKAINPEPCLPSEIFTPPVQLNLFVSFNRDETVLLFCFTGAQ
jgi:hypothetical protein